MSDDIELHLIFTTESLSNNGVTYAELGLARQVGETGYGCHTFYITDVFRNIVIIADIRLLLCLNIVSCAHINMQFVIFTS